MAAGTAIVLCFATGYLLVGLALPRAAPHGLLLRLSLAAGFGLGVFSASDLVGLAVGIDTLWMIDVVAIILLLIAYVVLRIRKRAPVVLQTSDEDEHKSPVYTILKFAFAIALCTAIYSAILRCFVHPNGDGWDAFSIWNLHARFLFRGGAGWRDGFNSLIPWSHPDYPLLLPSAIAHFWSYPGHESQIVPAAIGFAFTFSTVAALFSSLAILRGRTSALLGGLVLLATPFFIEQGTAQYADVPLSFFFLAAIALWCLGHRLSSENSNVRTGLFALSGLAAGLAAWTKNEGLLFVFALVISQLLMLPRARRRKNRNHDDPLEDSVDARRFVSFLIGLVPALVLIFWFKHSVAPRGDLFPDIALAFHKMLEPSRYWIVFRWYAKSLLRFGNWWVVPGTLIFPVFYFLGIGPKEDPERVGRNICGITMGVMLAGYFLIYLITPYDIFWHLRNSLNRLFLQLWPSAIFLFFLAAPRTMQQFAHSNDSPN